MKELNNAICSICGKPYHKCISCKDAIRLNPWRLYTDTSNCYKIYQVLHGLSTKVYDKYEAKNKLEKVDLSDLEDFRDNVKNIIKDILGENKEIIDKDVEAKSTEILANEINVSNENNFMSEISKVTRKRKSYKATETE